MNNIGTPDNARLLVIDGVKGKILIFDTSGNKLGTLVDECGGTPDGICIDPALKHVYWTNMGEHWEQNDGFIERINFDGSGRQLIIPRGGSTTPKQMKLDLKNQLIYWCDREGMRVMRSKLDGSAITTLVVAGAGALDQLDERNHCVGIAPDVENGYLYWTQKGAPNSGTGRILRAGLEVPHGENPANRSDIEVLLKDLPEPIDLEINRPARELFWTDRGDPPRGNSLNRISMVRWDKEDILTTGLEEAIGLALDTENNRVFVTDLAGNIYCSHLDGSTHTKIYDSKKDGTGFTGIVYLKNGL
jgi:hypothetical protein